MYLDKLIKQDYNNNGYAMIRSVIEPDLVERFKSMLNGYKISIQKLDPKLSIMTFWLMIHLFTSF